jgi:hypothetical protein
MRQDSDNTAGTTQSRASSARSHTTEASRSSGIELRTHRSHDHVHNHRDNSKLTQSGTQSGTSSSDRDEVDSDHSRISDDSALDNDFASSSNALTLTSLPSTHTHAGSDKGASQQEIVTSCRVAPRWAKLIAGPSRPPDVTLKLGPDMRRAQLVAARGAELDAVKPALL